jgi:hypothetical protein
MDKQDLSLLPCLPGALRGQRRTLFSLDTGFELGDQLHLKADIAGHLKGSVVPVLGQCLSRETPLGPPYALVAYVPASATVCVTYAERPAAHFEVGQHVERWFNGVQLYFAEIDVTDHAESLALERSMIATTITEPAKTLARKLYVFTWSDPNQQNAA